MNILLYNPDNGVTRNFMPHLWMFLLQALTPPEHKVHLIDGNAQPLTTVQLSDFIVSHEIGLVGIGAMTRMAWDRIDLTQFDLMRKLPRWGRYVVHRIGLSWQSLLLVPIESGRGCPYGCDFCTVTGFFGDSIRFRTNQSV